MGLVRRLVFQVQGGMDALHGSLLSLGGLDTEWWGNYFYAMKTSLVGDMPTQRLLRDWLPLLLVALLPFVSLLLNLLCCCCWSTAHAARSAAAPHAAMHNIPDSPPASGGKTRAAPMNTRPLARPGGSATPLAAANDVEAGQAGGTKRRALAEAAPHTGVGGAGAPTLQALQAKASQAVPVPGAGVGGALACKVEGAVPGATTTPAPTRKPASSKAAAELAASAGGASGGADRRGGRKSVVRSGGVVEVAGGGGGGGRYQARRAAESFGGRAASHIFARELSPPQRSDRVRRSWQQRSLMEEIKDAWFVGQQELSATWSQVGTPTRSPPRVYCA